MKTNNKGFSLVELMVVVAIIGILATMAVPQVNKFMAKARQAEAKTNLTMIYTANKAFFAEYNNYYSMFGVIGYAPEGRMRYNVGFSGSPAAPALNTYYPSGAPAAASAQAQITAATYCPLSIGGAAGTAACTQLAEAAAGGAIAAATITNNPAAGAKLFIAQARSLLVTGNQADVWTINQVKLINNTQNGLD